MIQGKQDMKMKEDYRLRCYKAFVSTKWHHTHSGSKKEYDFYTHIMKKRMKNIIPDNKAVKTIDLACGAGHFLYFLQQEGYINTYGLDISEEMLELARNMGVKNVEQGDIFTFLPAHKNSYDFIAANDIIEHLTKDEIIHLLDLIYDSLTPGGMVLIATLNAMSLFGHGALYNEFTHITGFTPTSLTQVLKVCRFNHIQTFGDGIVIHDVRSSIRAFLWRLIEALFTLYITIENGTGRGLWKNRQQYDPRFFAIAYKTESK